MSIHARLIALVAAILVPLGLFAVILLVALGASDARTHALFNEHLRPTVELNQVVQNFDQMREMSAQDILANGSAGFVESQRAAIAVQLQTLDRAIDQKMRAYGAEAVSPRQRGILHSWPSAWSAFLKVRSTALHQAAAGAANATVENALSYSVDDRLNNALDLVYALVAYEQYQGSVLDSAQTAASQHTTSILGFGFVLAALVGLGLALSLGRSVGRLYDDVKIQATHDGLTGLLNHRTFIEHLDARTKRGASTALLLIDVENFKLFNDVYGHPAGDAILHDVADVLRANCRADDVLARYGGDEFVALLHEATEEDARLIVSRLDEAMHEKPYRAPDGALIPTRLSIGLSCVPRDGRSRQEILAVAGADLYDVRRHERALMVEENVRPIAARIQSLAVRRTAADVMGDSAMGILEGLISAVDAKDSYTREHSDDVTRLALLLAETLGLGPEQQRALAIAGPIHDVGKVAVPDRILRKPGKLTDEEYEAIKRHVSYGVALIEGVLHDPLVVDAVAYHHERWDGYGYPHGLPGSKTPLLGRIMQVADAVSAMTLDRPYRRGMPWEQAMDVLRTGAGAQFDPALAEAFIDAVQERRTNCAVKIAG